MDPWSTVLGVVILLAAALALGLVFERLRQSAILGYLLAGTLLGPNALHLIRDNQAVQVIAELGVALLLFAIGLEFSWKRLKGIGATALALGVVQVLATATLGALAALALGVGGRGGVVIGSIVALSSTACVMRVLVDRAEVDSVFGRLALAVLLIQDLAVVVMVLLVTMMGGTSGIAALTLGMIRAVVLIALLFGAFYGLSHYLLPRLLDAAGLLRNRELLVLLAVVIALGSALAAHSLGLSPILGAFLAGMLLGESPFAVQVRSDVAALRALFVAIFFTSIGMLGDPAWIARHPLSVAALVVAITVGKSAVVAGAGLALRMPLRVAVTTGICLAQVGEFSFVLASESLSLGLINEPLFKLMVSATIMTLFLTPYMVSAAPWLAGRLASRLGDEPSTSSGAAAAHGDLPACGHVIVVGFGPAGQGVARALQRRRVPAVVIDMNPRSAAQARREGLAAQVGDATAPEVLWHVHLGAARGIVITLPDHRAVIGIVRQVKTQSPATPIIARARYHLYALQIKAAGADVVVDEEQHIGRRLGAAAKQWMAAPAPPTDPLATAPAPPTDPLASAPAPAPAEAEAQAPDADEV